MSEPRNYQSYLLRLWRDNPRAPWQASLQSTATEQVHHFPDVEQMWAFLKAQLSEERKAKIRRYIEEIWNKGNVGALDEFYATEVVRHHPPLPEIEGLDAYKQYATDLFNAYSDIQLTVGEIIVEGNTSATQFTFGATHTGQTPLSSIPPTGKRVRFSGCNVNHWAGDKVVEEWVYADFLGLMQQLGVVPAPGQS